MSNVGGKGQKRKRATAKGETAKTRKRESASNEAGRGGATAKRKSAWLEAEKGFKLSKDMVHNKHIADQADLDARMRKILRRVKWSTREDNMILLCGLVQKILKVKCPKADMSKMFVPWTVIRDMLKEDIPESFDKTSAAVSRRYRTLMKDERTKSNFSVCISDIKADKNIISDFMSRKENYEDPQVCREEFKELCLRLHNKFETQNNKKWLILPTSLRKLHDRYDLVRGDQPGARTMEDLEAQDVSSEDDVIQCVLYTIVMIAMLSHHYQLRNMKEIYYVLQQYDPDQLQKAITKFKQTGCLGRNRTTVVEKVQVIRPMHLMPMSYQFSKKFFTLLQSSSIAATVLTEIRTTLAQIMEAYMKAEKTNEESDKTGAVCVDDVGGNVAGILCLSALNLVEESVVIPQNILSLGIIESDRAKLGAKLEQDMTTDAQDGEFNDNDDEDLEQEQEEENADALSDASNMRLDRDGTKEGAEARLNLQAMKRKILNQTARRNVAFIRRTRREWIKATEEATVQGAEKRKSGMASLIPRLLAGGGLKKQGEDAASMETDFSSKGSLEEEEEEESSIHSLVLDHDYTVPPMAKDADTAGEPSKEVEKSQYVMVTNTGDTSSSTRIPQELGASDSNVDIVGSRAGTVASTVPSSKGMVESARSREDAYFTWLNMRGFMTQEYSKKPQNIHEDIVVQRCSLFMKPQPKLIHLLKDNLTAIRDTGTDHSESESCGTSSHRNDETRQGRQMGPQGGEQSEVTSRTNRGTEISGEDSSEQIDSLGELISSPCLPFRPFQMSNCNLNPVLDYRFREPRKSLEDVINGHKHHDMLNTLYRQIYNNGTLGVTYPELLSSPGLHVRLARQNAMQCLKLLLQEQLILEVGSNFVRLVALERASAWIVESLEVSYLLHPPSELTPEGEMEDTHSSKRRKETDDPATTFTCSEDNQSRRDDKSRSSPQVEGVGESAETMAIQTSDAKESQAERKVPNDGVPEELVGSTACIPQNEVIIEEAMESSTSDMGGLHNSRELGTEGGAEESSSGLPSMAAKRKLCEAPLDPLFTTCTEQRHPVSFVSHNWTNVDGTVNRKSLDTFAVSVALLVISTPGVKETNIFHQFKEVMTPVECLHVMKILINAGIVTRHATFTTRRLNPFARTGGTKPRPTVFFHPTAQALLNLLLLRENLRDNK